jgi:mono/diheme cytochrome c family protein
MNRHPLLITLVLGSALASAAAVGCYTGGTIDPITNSATGPGTSTSATEPTSPTAVEGLPCDVAQVLATSCVSCHGTKPSGGAPNSIVTYEDMVAPSTTDASITVAEASLARMKATKSPMPPQGATAADTAVLEAWIKGGMKKASCDTPVVTDPGASTSYDTPTVCTSNTTWNGRQNKSMAPGEACMGCHGNMSAGGTVYPTAHEPDDCNGVGGSQVIITDATGKVYTLPVNSAGNFYTGSTIKKPYTAKVVSGGKTRVMVGPQTNGDCNACHTEAGTQKAPGRVMAP